MQRLSKPQIRRDEPVDEAFKPKQVETDDDTRKIDIKKNITCDYCQAMRFFDFETPGICCSKEKVRLQDLTLFPQPLLSYLCGSNAKFNTFVQY